MSNKIGVFFRDLIVFVIACLITYKLPSILLLLLNSQWLLVNLIAITIGFICIVIALLLFSNKLSGLIFTILFAIYLSIAYIQAFILTDTIGKIICVLGIIGILSSVIKEIK